MESTLLESLGQIAGIGGIALGVFLLLFRKLLETIVVPGLTKAHWFKVIITFMILVWSVAILGIGAWGYGYYLTNGQAKIPVTLDPTTGKTIETVEVSNLDLETHFIGEWKNIDENTPGITRFTLKKSGGSFFINTWGSCSPRDCAWGEVEVETYTKDVSSNGQSEAIVLGGLYDQNFAETSFTIRPDKNSTLYMETTTRFKDGSGRSSFVSAYQFAKK